MINVASVFLRAIAGVAVIAVGTSASFLLADRFDNPWYVLVLVIGLLATCAATVWFLAWTGRYRSPHLTR